MTGKEILTGVCGGETKHRVVDIVGIGYFALPVFGDFNPAFLLLGFVFEGYCLGFGKVGAG